MWIAWGELEEKVCMSMVILRSSQVISGHLRDTLQGCIYILYSTIRYNIRAILLFNSNIAKHALTIDNDIEVLL
jgi:hypothetical protein